MQLNANLSKFEQSEHIVVNDVKQIPKKTIQLKRINGTNPNLGGTNKLKSLLDPQKQNDKLILQTTVQSIHYSKD